MATRREFLQQSLGLGAGVLSMPALLSFGCSRSHSNAEMGLQVYSVRKQLKSDFTGTLKQVAGIGYKNIEAYGLGKDGKYLGKVTPAAYKQICNDLGMKLVATHCGYCEVEDARAYIDAALESGVEYLIVPYISPEIRQSVDDYKRVAETFNKVGEKANAAGLGFGYHNHAFEFATIDGQIPMEILLNETDPSNVTFELDLFWITKGGLDPVAFINKHNGRFTCFHIKDANKDLEAATAGQGIIDFAAIFASNRRHLRYYFVEDERVETPMENIQAAHSYLINADFV